MTAWQAYSDDFALESLRYLVRLIDRCTNLGNFASWIFPVIKNMPATPLLSQLLSVQPMSAPPTTLLYADVTRRRKRKRAKRPIIGPLRKTPGPRPDDSLLVAQAIEAIKRRRHRLSIYRGAERSKLAESGEVDKLIATLVNFCKKHGLAMSWEDAGPEFTAQLL